MNPCKVPNTPKTIPLGIAFTTESMGLQTFTATPFMTNLMISMGWGTILYVPKMPPENEPTRWGPFSDEPTRWGTILYVLKMPPENEI